MPRVYFHLYNSGGLVPDEEGRQVPDMSVARAKAIHEIRSLLSEETKQGKVDLCGRIEIADAAGELLGVVLFADAVQLFVGPTRQ